MFHLPRLYALRRIRGFACGDLHTGRARVSKDFFTLGRIEYDCPAGFLQCIQTLYMQQRCQLKDKVEPRLS